MIPFFIGAIVGGFVGMFATCCCVAASDRTESACAEAYEQGKREGRDERCMRAQCQAYERWIERGE